MWIVNSEISICQIIVRWILSIYSEILVSRRQTWSFGVVFVLGTVLCFVYCTSWIFVWFVSFVLLQRWQLMSQRSSTDNIVMFLRDPMRCKLKACFHACDLFSTLLAKNITKSSCLNVWGIFNHWWWQMLCVFNFSVDTHKDFPNFKLPIYCLCLWMC